MREYVIHPYGDRVLVELEKRPDQLKMSIINNFGIDINNILQGLGFVRATAGTEGNLILMNTPEKLLGKDWSLSHPKRREGEEQDPNIFTVYLNHGGDIGYMEFFKQIAPRQGDYRIFFP